MEKTLIILIGNARGGETAWNTLYNNLIDPYNADLLLCFGKTINASSSLYKIAKYIFEIDEYDDWTDYYEQFFHNFWKKSFLCGQRHGLAGGLNKYNGSGAIIFAFRHFLKQNCYNIINEYDRIILTRSDHFYQYKHPVLPNDKIWIPEGEDYGGITDRHHIFPSKIFHQMLGVVEYMDSDIGFQEISKKHNPNPETVLLLSFKYYNILSSISRFKRCQFAVATKQDSTRWKKGDIPLPNYPNLYIKYLNEYRMTLRSFNEETK